MKPYRIISWIFCICILSFLVSCQTNPDTDLPQDTQNLSEQNTPAADTVDTNITDYVYRLEEMAYHNGYLYFENGSNSSTLPREEGAGTLVRYNIESGTCTYVCPDPLCMHNTMECPFAGDIYMLAVTDNQIFTKKTVKEFAKKGINQFSTFDLKTLEANTFWEEPFETFLMVLKFFHDKEWWYYESFVHDEETNKYVGGVSRLNSKTGKKEDIRLDAESQNATMLFIIDDRIYFSDSKSIFSTDMQLKNKTKHIVGSFVGRSIYTDGKYIYYGEQIPRGDSLQTESITRYSLDGTEVLNLDIVSAQGYWFLTDNYLYYMDVSTPSVDDLPISYHRNAIYRCRHDGTEKEKVFDLHRYGEDGTTMETALFLLSPIVVDDTIYAHYSIWQDKDQNGKYKTSEDVMGSPGTEKECSVIRLDLTTNTYEIIYPMQ